MNHLATADAARIPLRDGSVHAVVTSPPYFSLRRYSGEQQRDWPAVSYAPMPGLPPVDVPAMRCALGLEPTPEAYVAHIVLVWREIWRVLREDGVCWVVIGDSYNTRSVQRDDGMRTVIKNYAGEAELPTWREYAKRGRARYSSHQKALQDGDLVGVPARVMFALQGDGWIIRNDNVWAKKNSMPESVSGTRWERHRVKVGNIGFSKQSTSLGFFQIDEEMPRRGNRGLSGSETNAQWQPCPGCATCAPSGGYVLRRGSWRHTRAHETVLQLVKSMGYFCDQEKVREPLALPDAANGTRVFGGNTKHGANIEHGHRTTGRIYDKAPSGRNPRSVLHLSSEPWPKAHYATFPRALVAPLIRAATPAKACARCGAGWAPVVERRSNPSGKKVDWREKAGWPTTPDGKAIMTGNPIQDPSPGAPSVNILGYKAPCECGIDEWVPGTVLDCFVGSGTVLQVARELGVRGVGLDLSHEYLDEQAKVRARVGQPSGALDDLPLFDLLEDASE